MCIFFVWLLNKSFLPRKKKKKKSNLFYHPIPMVFFWEFPSQETPLKLGKKMCHETNHVGGDCRKINHTVTLCHAIELIEVTFVNLPQKFLFRKVYFIYFSNFTHKIKIYICSHLFRWKTFFWGAKA